MRTHVRSVWYSSRSWKGVRKPGSSGQSPMASKTANASIGTMATATTCNSSPGTRKRWFWIRKVEIAAKKASENAAMTTRPASFIASHWKPRKMP